MLNKPATTLEPIHDLLARRWSPRAFDPDRPVSHQQIIALLEAARWAPSCFGNEPWRFLVWNRHQDPTGWQKAFDCLADGNKIWVKNVPVLVMALASGVFRHDGSPNRWSHYDTGAASMSLCLQAVAMGLSAHQMGGFDEDCARATFAIPEDIACLAMIAIGHQADSGILTDEELKKRELAPRQRRAFEEMVFDGQWGNPFKP